MEFYKRETSGALREGVRCENYIYVSYITNLINKR